MAMRRKPLGIHLQVTVLVSEVDVGILVLHLERLHVTGRWGRHFSLVRARIPTGVGVSAPLHDRLG